MKTALTLAAACAALGLAASAQAGVGYVISAGYLNDSPQIVITNTGDVDLTGATLFGDFGNGTTDTVSVSDILAGQSVTVDGGSTPFGYDPDDYYPTDFSITFSATAGGGTVSSTFSPDVNDQGAYVGFEGNEFKPPYDSDFSPVQVAHYATPEPATVAPFVLGGLALLGLARRGKKRA